jgi:hypothetical protein
MTDFESIDPLIRRWSADNAIPLFTEYRGESVRSFDIVGPSARRCQIWIESAEPLAVHVWDYGKRRERLEADFDTVRQRLDDALEIARSWVS